MNKRRGKRVITVVIVVTALVVAVYFGRQYLAGSAHRINPYTAVKVRLGMTQKEVEAVFGAPPGDYSSKPKADQAQAPVDRRPDLRREDWSAEEGGAVVYFGPDGKVADCTLWITPGRKMTMWESIRKWWYWLTVW
jgi:hypothetical protein